MKNHSDWYRIAEIERLSGIPRRTIHFYLQQGLLHAPRRTGKTMAYYDELHLRQLAFIQKEKQEGVPLIAIKEKMSVTELSDPHILKDEDPAIPRTDTPPSDKRMRHRPRGGKTREAILDIGCALFREKGYKETKVTDIVTLMNVGKGTFYFYFSDKKELLLECVPRIFRELFEEGWERIRKIDHPLKRLEMRAQTVLPVLKEFCAIIQLSKEAMEEEDPKLRQLGEQTYRSICRPLESDIQKGIKAGLIQPVNPRLAACFMIGIMENLYYLQTIDPSLRPERIWDRILKLISHGIAG